MEENRFYEDRSLKMGGVIYKVTNLINGKCYIGQTIRSFSRRKSSHLNSALRKSDKMIFHSAIRKYGVENFKWEILEECRTKDSLNRREREYIKELKTHVPLGYNLNNGGNSVEGLGQSTYQKEQTSKRMKENNPMKNKEVREKMSKTSKIVWANPELRKKHYLAITKPEVIEKQRVAKLGDKNPNFGKGAWGRGVKGWKKKTSED